LNHTTLLMKAAFRAATWHSAQRRKGTAAEPYINHLLEVANLVAEATGGDDTNLVVAALLHDAVEDQPVSRATIAAEFGEEVAAVVMEVTDDKSLPKAERKRLQIENAPHKSPRASIIKVADKISNLRALASSPPADWPMERQLAYVQWARDVVARLPVDNAFLLRNFAEAADAAEQAAG